VSALDLTIRALSMGKVGVILTPELAQDPLEPGEFLGNTLILPAGRYDDPDLLAWVSAYQLHAMTDAPVPRELSGLFRAIRGRRRAINCYPGAERCLSRILDALWDCAEPVDMAPSRREKLIRMAKQLLWFGRIKGTCTRMELELARKLLRSLELSPDKAAELLPRRGEIGGPTGSEIYRTASSAATVRRRGWGGIAKILGSYTLYTVSPAEAIKNLLKGRTPVPPSVHYYHEWDCVAQDYRRDWCRVIEYVPYPGVKAMTPEHEAVTNALRELLLSPTEPVNHEDGFLDAGRLIEVLGEPSPSPREYRFRIGRTEPREVGFVLLLDASSSMKGKEVWLRGVAGSLILALHRIGVPFLVLAFKSAGRGWVEVARLGDMRDPEGTLSRLSSLRVSEYTRMGAAVRHATHLAISRGPGWRILVLSDLKPRGLGLYRRPKYSLADSAKAVEEAFSSGVPVGAIAPEGSCTEWIPCAEAGDVEDLPRALGVLLS